MNKQQKKLEKNKYKLAKKLSKKGIKDKKKKKENRAFKRRSKFVLFADFIKGILYLILSISLILSIILGEKGVIITLNDIIDNLFFATAGKIILFFIGSGLFFYGLKQLKILK